MTYLKLNYAQVTYLRLDYLTYLKPNYVFPDTLNWWRESRIPIFFGWPISIILTDYKLHYSV